MTTLPTGRRLSRDLDLPLLGGAPDAPALITPQGTTTYAELASAVRAMAALLGPERRLVLLEARNDVRTVVTYLAALAGHHPVLLVGAGANTRADEIRDRYAPDATSTPSGLHLADLSDRPRLLHPDLAQLLSTSGSTGSPKLVRLSLDNVVANARSIADYLAIRPDDRAITSLPLHYCYGLSVLTSHLVSGAGLVLTDLSVADACFWDLATASGASSFAGVPYTFDLLEASGFAERDLPSLRYVTQAGGRLAPHRVTQLAKLGRRRGWDLVVMYGQTEATARMAYLPPDLATARPTAIGLPVPGGHFRLSPVDDVEQVCGEPEIGELVYSGPNVMMGYAETPRDLARGPELTELHTGDLGRRAPDGLWEVTGRIDRHVKVFGLRLDLEHLEGRLDDEARLVVHDEVLHAFVDRPRAIVRTRTRLADLAGLPPGAVRVHQVATLPLTASGKVDDVALRRHAATLTRARADSTEAPSRITPESLRDLFAACLGRPDAALDDTFVSLGGDSLSFVEVSTRLGRALGHLPPMWQTVTIRDLAATARAPRRGASPVEMTVLLRALAIVAVLVTHTDIALVPGGAHVLLAVVGFNLARFPLATPGRRERAHRLVASVGALAVPAALWIAGCALVTGDYRPTTALFLNGLLGSDGWDDNWQFWFLEAVIWTTAALAVTLAVPAIDRLQRAHRFAFPMGLALAALVLRYAWTGMTAGETERYSVLLVLWCVAAGWAAAEASTTGQRLAVVGFGVVATHGFFADVHRETIIAVGIALLLWNRPLRLPTLVGDLLRIVAGASLWIYLTHWQVYPRLEDAGHPVLGVLASVGFGVMACWLHGLARGRLRGFSRASRSAAG